MLGEGRQKIGGRRKETGGRVYWPSRHAHLYRLSPVSQFLGAVRRRARSVLQKRHPTPIF
jgi:hypothetical protein